MGGVVSPATGMTANQPALVAMPSGTPQSCANESATPIGSKRTSPDNGTPSGGTAVRLACANAATILGDFTNATASSKLLERASALNELMLAPRESEKQIYDLCAAHASAAAAHDLRLAALATAHDLRITALVARSSDPTAFEGTLARLDVRVTSLEGAASADLPPDVDAEAARIFADSPLDVDAVAGFAKNIQIAGQVKSDEFQFLSLELTRVQGRAQQARGPPLVRVPPRG